jgi:hypothetical protein
VGGGGAKPHRIFLSAALFIVSLSNTHLQLLSQSCSSNFASYEAVMVVLNAGLLEVSDFGVAPSSGGLSCFAKWVGCNVDIDANTELCG